VALGGEHVADLSQRPALPVKLSNATDGGLF
jgi:hypothetical protein